MVGLDFFFSWFYMFVWEDETPERSHRDRLENKYFAVTSFIIYFFYALQMSQISSQLNLQARSEKVNIQRLKSLF